MRKVFIALLALIATTFGSMSALAHPQLKAATPAPGSVLHTAPAELRLTFNEPLLMRFSGAQVTDQRGRVVPTAARITANKKQIIVVFPARLPAGVYRVAWRVVSGDAHRTTGRYIFRVA